MEFEDHQRLNFPNDSDLIDFENKWREYVEKSRKTEEQLKETRQQMQEVKLTKLELERILDRERRELSDTKTELKMMKNTMQKLEQERSNGRHTSLKQSLQVESLTKERDILNEQVKSLELTNVQFKLKIEEKDKQLNTQQALEEIFKSKSAIINTKLDNIYSQNRKLEKEHDVLKKTVAVSKNLGEKMILLLQHHHDALTKTYAENDLLTKADISKIAELETLKNKNPMNESFQNINSVVQSQINQCEKFMIEMKKQMANESEEKRKLSSELQNTLAEQLKFNEIEQHLRKRISDLEKEVELRRNFQEKAFCLSRYTQTVSTEMVNKEVQFPDNLNAAADEVEEIQTT